MKISSLYGIRVLVTAVALFAACASIRAASGWVSLFDGKSLDQWVVKGGSATYRVEDGAIVGTTVDKSPNTFLCTTRDYGNFELELQVLCDRELNSGIQIRSHVYENPTPQASNPKRIREKGEVYGYQCEITTSDKCVSGNFWDEGRRTKWLDDITKKPGACAAFKDGEWNHYRIVAQGDRIRSWVNGVPCADFRDSLDATGFIGLQVHGIKAGKGPYQVRWKDIKVRELDGQEGFFGRWALSFNKAAGWLEVKRENGWFDGSLLWGGGSVLPVANIVIDDDVLTVTMVKNVERKSAAGEVVRTQQITGTVTARLEGDTLKGTRVDPRPNGKGFTTTEFTGKRIPPLPNPPKVAQVKFGKPIALFNGRDLSGWRVKDPQLPNAWSVENGVLVNRPPAEIPGKPKVRTANLRTEREFEDFNLKLEVNVPKGSNSGVYLRGIYEIQVHDSYGKPLDSHNMGALYSRITPAVAAEKPPGEWQTMDITLVDRHVTVVLNGKTIIDNQPTLGCTGGAMTSDEFRPGPIFLQGDHGPVSYRNITLRPVVE